MSGRFTLSDLPPRYQRMASEQIYKNPDLALARLVQEGAAAKLEEKIKSAKRLRQNSKPILNVLETAFHAKLAEEFSGMKIYAQAVRLELARGIWYKPDFFIPDGAAPGRPIAFEVKGQRAFRGGFENLKVAARVHPWISFILAWREGDEWHRQKILP